ncbi:Rab family protein (fragment) [Planktothrix serta PCC 8927]|uniref:Rab family protein n=1 Tax=Planktothrix serta PCC 8927 TaxID=671068 RepID=A0A7Z9BW13_9CYAN
MNKLSKKRTIQQRISGILFILTVIGLPTLSLAQSEADTPTFKTFQDWCSNRQQLSPEARRTVDVLLQQVGTSDCDRANQMLSEQERLDLSTFLISDLSPLTGLTHLTSLRINNNQISDLTPLQSLTDLKELDLSFNKITDISPLQPLTQLVRINLSYNQISDISPLQSLTSLIEVYLNHNKIVDITDLKALTKLRFLFIQNNPLTSTQCPINPKYVCRFDR